MTPADRPSVTDYPDASEVLDVIYGVGYAASSMVQRKLGLTFRQAEDVLAALGRCGVVGKAKGSAARKILVTRPEAEVILGMDDPEAMASEVPVQDHPRLSVHDVIGALGDLPEGEDSVSVIRKQRDAADRPTVTDNASADRATIRANWEHFCNGHDVHPSDMSVSLRAFNAGWRAANEWAAGRAETTTATDEDAARVITAAMRDGSATTPEDVAMALDTEGLLATARTHPTREAIARAIAARHWDRDSGEVEPWDQLTAQEQANVIENYAADDSADAVLALLKGGTDE